MRAGHGRLLLGVLLIAAASAVLPPEPIESEGGSHPLAAALAPLGPVKACVSSALWFAYLRQSDRAAADLSEALIALHPDLDSVRTFLARQLVITEASRAPDRERHRRFILRGLRLLEEGLLRRDSDELHSALARLLVIRRDRDPWFSAVVEEYFGLLPSELAIEQLRAVEDDAGDAELLATLLVERGLRSYERSGDPWDAQRDLREAVDVLRARSTLSDEQIDGMLGPLRRGLDQPRPAPDRPAPDRPAPDRNEEDDPPP